ncbi:hypothetical protein [Arthrobacter sp. zg-Y1143]|uniref:hypothetical protein n=1 Tax=Arthrobacter sp. zg-Y1143 TaxID=3049065 RepID=UPI0024C23D7F|nr:hypothetical protein [Arthrobacter sp. zg-Y1143]MDK1329055.1 hypothetical protein [Arthrobacter sp. zg-Y1143]
MDSATGYLIYPNTSFLIEPGSLRLIDRVTGLYTGGMWDPATMQLVDPDAVPSPSPSTSPSPTATPSITPSPTTSATPSGKGTPTASALDVDQTGASGATGWPVRIGVVVLLLGAAAFYYMKLRSAAGPRPFKKGNNTA